MKRPSHAAILSALFATSTLLYVACGDDETPATPAGETDGGGGDATVDSGGGNDSGGGSDTGSGEDTGSADTGGGDSSTDGGSDAPADVTLVGDTGSTFNDASPGGDAAVLNCGTAQCNLPAETCCIYPAVSPPFYGACSNGNSCPAIPADAGVVDGGPATELQCEVNENCTGNNVCCIQGPQLGSQGGGKITSHCVSAGACVTSTTQVILDAGPDADGGIDGGFVTSPRAILCNPAAADAGCNVTDAGACSSANIGTWNLPNGFGTCGGQSR